jgi:GntR family transcriptional regulator
MLNPQSPIPLYRQLADLLLAQIREGAFEPGSRVPSEPKLAAEHRIGRPTVRQAIDLLVRKGVLRRRRGSGTYVCEPQQEVDLLNLDGTSASFQRLGVAAGTRILVPIHQRLVQGETDNPFDRQLAYFFSRLTLVEEVPVLVEDMYLDPTLFAGLDQVNLAGESLSAVAESRYFLRPTGGKQRFRIAYAADERGRHLQVEPDQPVLVVQRFLHFPQKQNGVYAELWCRSDRFAFTQTIGGAVYA